MSIILVICESPTTVKKLQTKQKRSTTKKPAQSAGAVEYTNCIYEEK